MSPYQHQNIPAVVVNNNGNEGQGLISSNAPTSVITSKQKNVLYGGVLFLAIVAVTMMISMKGGVGGKALTDPEKEEFNQGYGSLTNLRTTTKTCPPCEFPTSTNFGHGCDQICHNTKANQQAVIAMGFGAEGVKAEACKPDSTVFTYIVIDVSLNSFYPYCGDQFGKNPPCRECLFSQIELA